MLAPLVLERRLDSRLWGGTTLGPWLGLTNPPPQLAESWQVYEHNRVTHGPHMGETLGALARAYGSALLGRTSYARHGAEFPLLAKFLDAADHLSIQVHPDDTYAHTVEAASGFHGKTEAWYILRAADGAGVYHGMRAATSRTAFAAAIADGTVLDLLRLIPVAAGDTIFVAAGTVHAINAGVMLFEIQQKSDLTYRVYDYQRRDATGALRELHLDRALDVSDYQAAPAAIIAPQPIAAGRELLVECPYFRMERWQATGTPLMATTTGETFALLTIIAGDCQLTAGGTEIDLPRGSSAVLPANLGAYTLETTAAAQMLVCSVPG